MEQEQISEYMYIIKSGMCRKRVRSGPGRSFVLSDVGAGWILGYDDILAGARAQAWPRTPSPCYVFAESATVVALALPRSRWRNFIERCSGTRALAKLYGMKARRAEFADMRRGQEKAHSGISASMRKISAPLPRSVLTKQGALMLSLVGPDTSVECTRSIYRTSASSSSSSSSQTPESLGAGIVLPSDKAFATEHDLNNRITIEKDAKSPAQLWEGGTMACLRRSPIRPSPSPVHSGRGRSFMKKFDRERAQYVRKKRTKWLAVANRRRRRKQESVEADRLQRSVYDWEGNSVGVVIAKS